ADIRSDRSASGNPPRPMLPALHRAFEKAAVEFAFSDLPLLVKTAAIDHGLGFFVSTEDDQQVGDHSGLTLLIKFYDLMVIKFLQSHLHHAYGPVDDHLPGINDSGGLLPLEHDGGNFRRVSQVGDAGFENFKSGFFHFGLEFLANAFGHDCAGTTEAVFVRLAVAGGVNSRGYIVRVYTNNIADGAVALQGKVFFVIIHVEHSLGGVDNAPHDGDTDFHGVAQNVIYLLFAVV